MLMYEQAPLQKLTLRKILLVGGIFTTAFSLIAGLLITFALGSACSVVGGIALFYFEFLFLIGIVALILGLILSRRKTITAANPG